MRVRIVVFLAIVEICVLAFMAGQREWVLRSGQTVTLRTEPVDPSDPMRGQYIRLSYGFSQVRRAQWSDGLAVAVKAAGSYRRLMDMRVYAAMSVDDTGLAEFVSLSDRPPANGPYLAGRVDVVNVDIINVRYGIEALFLQQGAARAVEAARIKEHAGAPLDVDVAVGASGMAVLKAYSWEPLGITVTIERPSGLRPVRGAAQPQTGPTAALVKLVNYGPADVAVVKVPDGGSFSMVPDKMRTNGHPEYNWAGESNAPADLSSATVVVLKPGQTLDTRIDLTQSRWFVTGPNTGSPNGVPVSLHDLKNGWNAWFRIQYSAPTPAQSAGLPHADLIWHRAVTSRAFGAMAGVD
jgi:uncharacterized membrane-anchored protein